jgi:NitT/TauT family transport system substrate-binding protein
MRASALRAAVLALAWICAAVGTIAAMPAPAAAETTMVRVGWCARTLTSAAAPFAIATKMGWFADGGIRVQPVPIAGTGECVKTVATRELPYVLSAVESLAVGRLQGIKAKIFYTAYQGSIYGITVPADSPVKTFADLKGKKIGVIALGSAGALVARALAAASGLNPDRDISLVVAGEAAQTAALIRSNQVDALSQFDTNYALIENAGVRLRPLEADNAAISRFPSNGFMALEETLASRRAEALALAKGYARGTVFAMANPEAAVRILHEVFPQTKATGKDDAAVMRDDVRTLEARARNWRLEPAGVTKWGESSHANYDAQVAFLTKHGVLKEPVPATDLFTNELIDEANDFDAAAVIAMAKGYKTD